MRFTPVSFTMLVVSLPGMPNRWDPGGPGRHNPNFIPPAMFKNFLFLFALFGTIVYGCSSTADERARINYATLDSLQTEVVLEIGESEAYLPGNLTALIVVPGGDMLVADWASSTIEQFDQQGNHRATIAKPGKGPGELGDYFWMYGTGGDTVLVNQQFVQLDYFVAGPDGIYRFVRSVKKESMPDRSFSIRGAQSDTSYYATANSIFSSAAINPAENSDYRAAAMVVVNSAGEVLQDSVQMYKTANPHIRRQGNSISIRSIPLRFDDDLAIVNEGGYLIARSDSNAIFRYDSAHRLVDKIPLRVVRRPVTSRDLEYHLGDVDAGVRNALENRIGDYKPPFLAMWATNRYIWLHTDTGEAGKQIVVLDYEGTPIGKFRLPEVDQIEHVEGNKMYTIHESPDRGDLVRVYRVAL